jgi:hypothetical protein
MMSNITNLNSISDRACYISVLLCLISSTICTLLPLLKWLYYSPKEVKLACALEWRYNTVNVMSYSIAVFVFAFIVPLIIIAITAIKIIKIV